MRACRLAVSIAWLLLAGGPMTAPRFSAIANLHAATKNQWPWAVLDTATDELCAFASSQETAETRAAALNANINALGSLPEVRRLLRRNEL